MSNKRPTWKVSQNQWSILGHDDKEWLPLFMDSITQFSVLAPSLIDDVSPIPTLVGQVTAGSTLGC